jgi:hypothetical protein
MSRALLAGEWPATAAAGSVDGTDTSCRSQAVNVIASVNASAGAALVQCPVLMVMLFSWF